MALREGDQHLIAAGLAVSILLVPLVGAAQAAPPSPASPAGGLAAPKTPAAAFPPPPARTLVDARWADRKAAIARGDRAAEEAAVEALDRLRLELGIDALSPYALAMLREARRAIARGQYPQALVLCRQAARLAPSSPEPHFVAAHAMVGEDPFAPGPIVGELFSAVSLFLRDPRRVDAMLANGLVGFGLAFLFAAVVFFALQLARHLRCLRHDVTVALGAGKILPVVVLGAALALPIVLQLAPLALVLVWAAAVWIYQRRGERVVSLVFLALLAGLPFLGHLLAPCFAYQSQLGLDLRALQGGDPSAEVVSRAEARLRREPKDVELAALLARVHKLRGEDSRAEALFRQALAGSEKHPTVLNNYGNLLLVTGRTADALALYERAASASGGAAAVVQYNLAQALAAQARKGDVAALDRHGAAMAAAERIDPGAVRVLRAQAGAGRNRTVIDLPLPEDEVRRRAVRGLGDLAALDAQLWERVAPWLPRAAAPFVPLGLALLLAASWRLIPRWRFASACSRCEAVVDTLTNPELAMGDHCSQCHHVFRRGAKIDPKLRLEREAEIRRGEARRRRVRVVSSALLMGAGQVLAGRPARGALLLVLFFWILLETLFWSGVVRYPLSGDPSAPVLKFVVLALVFLPAYLAGLAGVSRR